MKQQAITRKTRQNLNKALKKYTLPTLGLTVLGSLYTLILAPNNIRIPCLFYELTGYYDAFEGMTSSLYHLFHGNFYTAFRLNPLIYGIPILAFIIIYSEVTENRKLKRVTVITALATLLAFTVLRNIEPFYFLRPVFIP